MFLFSKQGGPGPLKGREGAHFPRDQKRSARATLRGKPTNGWLTLSPAPGRLHSIDALFTKKLM